MNVMLLLIGMASGFAVAAGLFTFLAITGVPHRLMVLTHTSAYGYLYEWVLIAGGIIGNHIWLSQPVCPMWAGVTGMAGLSIGIFIGCLIGAIAEVLDAFPVFIRRTGIRKGIAVIITAMATGKAAGAWLYYFMV